MIVYTADWILPVSTAPIPQGALVTDGQRIVAVGAQSELLTQFPTATQTALGQAVLMPGLVNAHTHLELSVMRNSIPDGLSFSEWAYRVITSRAKFSDQAISSACNQAAVEMKSHGTLAVGDIANHVPISRDILSRENLLTQIFHELTGLADHLAEERFSEFHRRLDGPRQSDVRESLAAHALYSVSPRLAQMIDRDNRASNRRTSIHLAESLDEVSLLETGEGAMKSMIQTLGRWDESWRAPACSPVEYASRLGLLGPDTLCVHGVHVSDHDIEILRNAGAAVCLCPRSNRKIRVGKTAPVRKYLQAGVPLALGTDSLASNDDLNLWNEARALRSEEPSVTPTELICIMTLGGASALGMENRIGTLETGKDARFIAVTLRDSTSDPESTVLLESGRVQLFLPAGSRS